MAAGRVIWDPKNTDIKLVIDGSNKITKAYVLTNNVETVLSSTDSKVTTAISNINNDQTFKQRTLGNTTNISVVQDYTKRNERALSSAQPTTSANPSDVQPPNAEANVAATSLGGQVQQALSDEKTRGLYDPIVTDNAGSSNAAALVYPIDLSKEQDRMVITMYRYRSVIGTVTGSEGRFGGSNGIRDYTGDGKPLAYIILPIPNQLPDVSEVTWAADQLSYASILGSAGSFIGGFFQNRGEKGSLVERQAGDSNKANISSALQGINYDQLLSRSFGVITNPNQDLLFQGNGLRRFNYQFDLFPRNKEESTEIRRIIRVLRQGMLPRKLLGGIFIGAPNTFRVRFIKGGTADEPLPDIRRHKELALTNFVADPVPGDIWMTYNDENHSTIGFKISLSFTELTPIYYNDYLGKSPNDTNPQDINGDSLNGSIGY